MPLSAHSDYATFRAELLANSVLVIIQRVFPFYYDADVTLFNGQYFGEVLITSSLMLLTDKSKLF